MTNELLCGCSNLAVVHLCQSLSAVLCFFVSTSLHSRLQPTGSQGLLKRQRRLEATVLAHGGCLLGLAAFRVGVHGRALLFEARPRVALQQELLGPAAMGI